MLSRKRAGLLALPAILCVAVLFIALSPRGKDVQLIRLDGAVSPSSQLLAPPPFNATAKDFAYVLYVTTEDYLCNSVVNARRLHSFDVTTEADIVVLYADKWKREPGARVAEMFDILKSLEVKLLPVHVIQQRGEPTWAESLTKLKIFKLMQYKRIIYFDVDGLIMKSLNHLFHLPAAPVAMPRAYWLDQPFFSDQLAVIEPSAERLDHLLTQATKTGGFDMDVINDIYKRTCLVLPNEYDFLSGELRKTDHIQYLGDDSFSWDAQKEMDRAFYVHFSDWPTPKPWLLQPEQVATLDTAPACPPYCTEKRLWAGLYTTFREEMQHCFR